MSRSTTHNVNDLISTPNGDVKALLDRLAKIEALNNTLQPLLPATLKKHCRVINIRKNTLIIAVSSSTWANKIRFQLPELLTQFREKGYFNVANIEVIVKPQ